MERVCHSDRNLRLSASIRALGIVVAIGVALGFALGIASMPLSSPRYFHENMLLGTLRRRLLTFMAGGGGAAVAAVLVYLFAKFHVPNVAVRLYHAARRLSPLALLGFLPILFRCEAWKGHDLVFLTLVMFFGATAWATLTSAMRAGPFGFEARLWTPLRRARETAALALPHAYPSLPFILVTCGVVFYVGYFGYYTYCFYYSLRSGYDLGIYDSLVWNMLHGGSFFKTPPWAGPGQSHFGNHAEFFAYVLVPLYALHQNAGTLLLIQAAFLGSAAIPLFKLARRHVGAWPACVIALTYLLYPALHGENLFEFHFLPIGPFLLWWAWYFLEVRRDGWATVFVLFTLACREDVSAWVAVLGLYFALTGRRPRVGVLLAVVGTLWCFALKFVAMPAVGGGESFTDIYKNLLPPGSKSFAGVVMTVLANPSFTVWTLAENTKLIYMLQILVPLAFLPFRRPIWALLALPGVFFTVLSTQYEPLVSISFQYSAHWIAFFFPGAALGLEWMQKRAVAAGNPALGAIKRRAVLATMICMALPVSYQYGAILQQTNAWGGPIKYTFGVDGEGKRRHEAMVRLLKHLPPRASVSASGFTTPFISNRPDAFNLTISQDKDAEYVLFPSEASDLIGDERATLTRLLRDGVFGIVAVEPPFALARRGHATAENTAFLARW